MNLAHHLIHAPSTEMISQSSASVSLRFGGRSLHSNLTTVWFGNRLIMSILSTIQDRSHLTETSRCFNTELVRRTQPSTLVTLDTSHLGECLRLEVSGVRRRLGNLRGAKIDQTAVSVFPGSVVASFADPTAADRAVGAAQTSVPSVLSSSGATGFPTTLTDHNSPIPEQTTIEPTRQRQNRKSSTLPLRYHVR